tara:strand:- start:299 stop:1000 length:702 start_codon:yes stop_codon:yes gene_type:complete
MSPTITNADPVSPSKELNFLGNLSYGRKQFSLVFRVFSTQYSQPELILLAKLVLDTNALHSSQISGFQRDTLRDPSPKLLFALGLINQAIARTQGVKGLSKGAKLPATKDSLWRDKQYMRNSDGTPMGPLDMFSAFAGLKDLGVSSAKSIPVRKEKAVAKALGKYMRLALAKLDIDYVSEIVSLKKKSKTIEKLVLNKPVSGSAIVQDLSALARLAQQGEEDLWGIAISPNLV